LPEVDLDLRDNAPLIAAGGGLLLFISLFLKWFGAEGIDESVSGWEVFSLIDIVLAAIALIVVGIGAMLATGNTANLPAAPESIVATASLIAFGIVAAQAIDPLEGIETKFGVWLAVLATIAMIVGGMQLGRGAGTTTARRAPEPPTAPPPPPPPPPASPTV
jgi:hypothetical protein